MSFIELKNIKKHYGSGDGTIEALRGINLSISEGDSVAIMGPSGCGKSTLLNILGFLDQVSEGDYVFENVNTSLFDEEKTAYIRNKKIGFVVQDFALIPRLNVLNNIMLPLEYTKQSRQEKLAKVDHLLNTLGIYEKKYTYPNTLSGGQKQRVAIARALVNDANILLCDEPTGALDSKTTEEIMRLFMRLNIENSKTLIIVTHDPVVANYCNRIVNIFDGTVTLKQ